MHLPRNPDLTGVILVGGRSRRMGRDKAFLELAGKTLFERVLGLFRENFERILLVGNHADRFSAYGLPVIPDIYSGSSLGGIYTGLHQSETEYVFVASCDLPFPNGEILRYLIDQRRGYDAVVATTADGYEPLFALYSKSCLEPIKSLIESGDYCAYAYFNQVRVRYVPYEELSHLDRDRNAFVNVNTPEEFEKIGGKIMTVKAVSFVAKSGTGKTTLLEKVIACLKERGYRVGVIKHDAHRFDIDHPGKDSYRLAAAGADTMLISSPEKLALVKKHDSSPPIENLISTYFTDVDIVLTEGFKKSSMPKIELHRKERSPVLLCRGEESDPSLIAVASDERLDLDVPLLDLNSPCEVADFIEVRFLR